jgi:gas vesicle protein
MTEPKDDELRIRMNLDNAPEVAKELGNMCAAWAALEFRMFTIFEMVADLSVPIARAIYFSHFNSRARFEMLKSVAAMIFRDDKKELTKEYDDLDKLLTSINDSAGKRNKYIHDPWAVKGAASTDVSQMRLGGKEIHGEVKEVEKKDLEQLTNQLNKWTKDAHEFQQRISPLLPALHEKLDKSRVVTLVSSKKRTPPEKKKEGP